MSDGAKLATPQQLQLTLTIEQEKEIDGIGMGVLSDGTPYLTGRGLARICGIVHNVLFEMNQGWSSNPKRPREQKIEELIAAQGGSVPDTLYLEIQKDNVPHYAYPDDVCMAIIEYYAFEAGPNRRQKALDNYRAMARRSLREFIYSQLGYDNQNRVPRVWQQFHDRVTLNYHTVPVGYFSIFKEVADIIVTLIRHGAEIGPRFVPDISIGQHWARYWRDNNLAGTYGERTEYEHNYPEYFDQAASNPQYPSCYPDAALPEFRRWLREVYLPDKLPGYLAAKVKGRELEPSFSQLALRALIARLDDAD